MQTPAYATSRYPAAFRMVVPVRRAIVPAGQVAYGDQSTDAGLAGMVDPLTGNPYPSGTMSVDANGLPLDASGNIIGGSTAGQPGAVTPGTTGTGTEYGNPNVSSSLPGKTGGGGTTGGTSGVSNQAIFNAVGGLLNTTGSAIQSAISAGNQVEIARLQSQAQTQIAAFQSQAAAAQAAGNMTLARQNAANAAQLQQFQMLLASQSQSRTMLYVVGGVVVLALVGTLFFFGSRPRAATSSSRTTRRNPPQRRSYRSRSRRNHWYADAA